MFEALEYYQSLAEKFDSRILTVPGIVVVIVGLCVWLAGLRWRKILGALAGGGFFAALAVSIGSYSTGIVLAVILIGTVIGALIEKVMLGIFGASAAAVIVLVVISTNLRAKQYSDIEYLNSLQEPTEEDILSQRYCPRWPEYEQRDIVISPPQAADITRQMASYVMAKIFDDIKSSSAGAFASAAFVMLAAAFAAFIIPRTFIAVVSSSLGSAVIFAGMIMLLFYKGSKPVNYIAEKSHFYIMVLAVMAAFGSIVQLVLSPPVAEQTKENMPDKKDGDKK
ncbi:MAG: hypothetical protein WC496_02915 [Phycisphaerae bacterium]|jgi:hypothetical protein